MPLTDQHYEAIAYALDAKLAVVKTIAESVWQVARREQRKEIISAIKTLASQCSPSTGYGNAQKTFAHRLISQIEQGAQA